LSFQDFTVTNFDIANPLILPLYCKKLLLTLFYTEAGADG